MTVVLLKIPLLSTLFIFFAALCSSRFFFFLPHSGHADNGKLISRLLAAGGRWSGRRRDVGVTSPQVPYSEILQRRRIRKGLLIRRWAINITSAAGWECGAACRHCRVSAQSVFLCKLTYFSDSSSLVTSDTVLARLTWVWLGGTNQWGGDGFPPPPSPLTPILALKGCELRRYVTGDFEIKRLWLWGGKKLQRFKGRRNVSSSEEVDRRECFEEPADCSV